MIENGVAYITFGMRLVRCMVTRMHASLACRSVGPPGAGAESKPSEYMRSLWVRLAKVMRDGLKSLLHHTTHTQSIG